MLFGISTFVGVAARREAPAPGNNEDASLEVLRDALLAIHRGSWDDAASALSREQATVRGNAACLNLTGVVCQARGQWKSARRFYGKAMRADRRYGPAEQNLRRLYELDTFGSTNLPVALADVATMSRVGRLRVKTAAEEAELSPMSHSILPEATMGGVKRAWDWEGYLWAIGVVLLCTAVGWVPVHSSLHLANANVLMVYLLGVLWVATHHSRGAAVLASVLAVGAFDVLFVEPYYTFAVAERQYVVTFGVMLVTALVISTLTDRVRRQSELARQAWERVETEFLRNTLLSGVSHELRTPLAAITGAASSLLETKTLEAGTKTDLLETICGESERMERLIRNLLDMTRMESGGNGGQEGMACGAGADRISAASVGAKV